MIGCGDVTELKSGPAFNKVSDSSLVAVMSRSKDKARDYAQRHHVPKWYDDATSLINDPGINAIYIATPPSSHEAYTIECLTAGKHVYVEKPMSLNSESGVRMTNASNTNKTKLVVAHYRREQLIFKKIKQLLEEKIIGDLRLVTLKYYQTLLTQKELEVPKTLWRVNPEISGGGLFHDLAPHQLDLMYYFFGRIDKAYGMSANQAKIYNSDDIVSGQINFASGLHFTGNWCFCVPPGEEIDICEIIGSKGKISFSVFGKPQIKIRKTSRDKTINFKPFQHVQQPMIEKVVKYFLGQSENPCSGAEASEVMKLIDIFTGKIN